MPHLRNSLLLLLALLAFSGRTPAQQPASTTDNTRPADAALRKKAFDLLETVADQVGTLQSPENRARLGSNIAALLWKHDEQRARTLLAAVQSDINVGLQKIDEDKRLLAHTRMVFLKLRMDTVERIAIHEAEAALAFLKATEPEADVTKSPDIAEMARSLEVRLANQIAAENPDVALRLGRKSLARGLSHDLLPLLKLLHKKDKEKALNLYKEIVAKLTGTGLKQYSWEFYFAQGLMRSFKPPVADEQTFRELVNLFIDTAFQNGCNKPIEDGEGAFYFCRELGSLLPQMEKADASRAAALQHWAPKPSERRYEATTYDEIQDVAENGTVDEMLALASKYPPVQYHIYLQAVAMAEASGDFERARKIATTHINDPTNRAEVIARLDRAQMWQSLTPEKLAEAQSVLNGIPDARGKITFLLHAANQIGVKDRKTALKLLGQAGEIIETMKPGREHTEAEISLAMMYCVEKDDRGLDRMQSLLPRLNELVAAAVKLEGYDSHNVRDGEWNMSNQGSIGSLLTLLSQGAEYFAECDFDRALNLAAQFERPEIRLMAQLKLAQGVLADRKKRPSILPLNQRYR